MQEDAEKSDLLYYLKELTSATESILPTDLVPYYFDKKVVLTSVIVKLEDIHRCLELIESINKYLGAIDARDKN